MADVQFTDVPLNESGSIPPEYTCDGEDVSPPLAWAAPPDAAESLVLIVDDPDAPVPDSFTHWVLFNLSTEVTALPRDYHAGDPRLEADALDPKEGINDFGDVQYGGPCPPVGEEHRYVFLP
jgi:Raf kinase inhibitor-like YbhB/YbcL family protein